ncbi:glycosyltransferase family 2 protein [Agaribacterium sp. ZY112]|uniref:glycosyltransferase family 2 protein n=1 Tax=Agaribacterium sp. ZY112 TaxID=3233574 RepID=UPI00352345AF
MPSPLVSIILPVYNVEAYLEQCLLSVLAQTYEYYELICVNDGATDSSLSILERFSSKFDGRMRIVSQENAGLAAARNTGLDLASGEYIYFLDSDDWIDAQTLAECTASIIQNHADLVVFNAEAFSELEASSSIKELNYVRDLPKALYVNESIFSDTYARSYIAQSCCYFYRRAAFINHRFIPGILHEDHYFTTRLFIEASSTVVLERAFFMRRIRPGSITTVKTTMAHAEGYYVTVAALSAWFNEKANVDSIRADFRRYLNSLLRDGLKAEFRVAQQDGRSVTLLRKLSLLKRFVRIVSAKTLLLMFFSRSFYRIKALLSKAKVKGEAHA